MDALRRSWSNMAEWSEVMETKQSWYVKRPFAYLAEGIVALVLGFLLIHAATGGIGGADFPRGDDYNGIYAVLVTFFFLYGVTQTLEYSLDRKVPNAASTRPAAFILSKFQNRSKGWVVFVVSAFMTLAAWRNIEFAADYIWILCLLIGLFFRHIYHRAIGYRLANHPSDSLRKMWLDLGRFE